MTICKTFVILVSALATVKTAIFTKSNYIDKIIDLITVSPSFQTTESDGNSYKLNSTTAAANEDHHHHWWQQYVEATSVVYKPSNNTDWCQESTTADYMENDPTKAKTGMYLVKVPKASSSTAAAVSLQITDSVAAEKNFSKPCVSHINHSPHYVSRTRPYFMWSTVRQPDRRTVSMYFFKNVSHLGDSYDSKSLISMLDDEKNFQIKFMSKKLKSNTTSSIYKTLEEKDELLASVYKIFHNYDFIAVTERMDESLVVMKLLFGLKDETIVVLDSKRSGSSFIPVKGVGDLEGRICHKIQPSFTTDDVDQHIAVDGEYRSTNLDYFLHAVADRSLDRTIDMLGRDRVQKELLRHQQLRQRAVDACQENVELPCTKEGDFSKASRDCYYNNIGCGHRCIMDTIQKLP